MGIFILGSIYADDFAVPMNVGGFAVTVRFLGVFLGAVAFAGAAAVAGAGAFAVAGAGAVAVAEKRSSRPMVVRLFSCGVLLAFLVMAKKNAR